MGSLGKAASPKLALVVDKWTDKRINGRKNRLHSLQTPDFSGSPAINTLKSTACLKDLHCAIAVFYYY
jgi:hypothetical protein